MRILIVRNNYNPKALESALLLEVYLASQGVEFTAFDTDDLRASSEFFQRRVENIDDFDLAVVLGGDGTILRTAAQIKYRRIPILGVNFGHLGFMANSNEDGIIPVVAAALAGELTTEYRTNLRIDVFCEGDEGANGGPDAPMKGSQQFFGLNELTLARAPRVASSTAPTRSQAKKLPMLRETALSLPLQPDLPPMPFPLAAHWLPPATAAWW